MNTDEKFLHSDETREIIGCACEVLNCLDHGFHEKICENALPVEFKLRNIPYSPQLDFDISDKDVEVGSYIPDLITFDTIVIDTKTIDTITNHETRKMINYPRVTKKPVGLIVNFKPAKLEWKRVAL